LQKEREREGFKEKENIKVQSKNKITSKNKPSVFVSATLIQCDKSAVIFFLGKHVVKTKKAKG
jgi:hypothetical protein